MNYKSFHTCGGYFRLISLSTMLIILAGSLQAQRGVRVPVPQGGGNLFPDWVFLAIFGIIALVIVVNIIGWIVSCFRDFRSFSDLLALAGGLAATWLLRDTTGWGFGWCLLAGYAAAVTAVSMLNLLHHQVTKRN